MKTTGHKIILRPFLMLDINQAYLNAINSRSSLYLYRGRELWDMTKLSEYVKTVLQDEDQEFFAIIDKSDLLHIGNFKIRWDHKNRSAHFGRLIWRPNKGIGTEAHKLMVNYVFTKDPYVNYILNGCISENIGSIISNMKAGFTVVGFTAKASWLSGHQINSRRCDTVWLGMERKQWEDAQELYKISSEE